MTRGGRARGDDAKTTGAIGLADVLVEGLVEVVIEDEADEIDVSVVVDAVELLVAISSKRSTRLM